MMGAQDGNKTDIDDKDSIMSEIGPNSNNLAKQTPAKGSFPDKCENSGGGSLVRRSLLGRVRCYAGKIQGILLKQGRYGPTFAELMVFCEGVEQYLSNSRNSEIRSNKQGNPV
jgi:hypothetical protein